MTDAALAAPPTPFKGLAPFGESELDTLLFFGREREVEVIAANLVAARLTILYGPSGVGKTSLLRAGVVTRLRDEGGAVVVHANWSSDSTEALLRTAEEEARRVQPDVGIDLHGRSLAEAFADWRAAIGGELYVVLDQFEEYFLYRESGGPFEELAEIMRSRELRANFLISIREDALAQLDAFKTRIPNLFGNSLRLDRLDRQAARRAILGPLERYNELAGGEPVVAEDELVDEVLDSVRAGQIQLGPTGRGGAEEPGESGQIEAPYLQLVLERLWNVERQRDSTRLRLATLRELGGATRIVEEHLERAMSILSPEEQNAAAAMYNHLVTPSGTKIAHRAGDLARYASVEEEQAERVLDRLARERIVRAAEDGAAGPQYEIFHDVLADAVLAWRTRHESEQRLERERRQVARRHRKALWLALAAGVALTILAVAGVYALAQRRAASENEREARAHDLAAVAEAALATNPERSLELALRASRAAQTPTVEDALRRTLRALRVQAVIRGRGPVADLAVAPDGSRLAVVTSGEAVRLYEGSGTSLIAKLPHSAVVASFSADGSRVVTAGEDGSARVWDAPTGKAVFTVRHGGRLTQAFFAPDGTLLATTGGNDARLWDARSGRRLRRLRHPGRIATGSFSPDGRLIVTTAGDRRRSARIFDVRSGRLVATLRQPGSITVARFDPTGKIVATGGADDLARLWESGTGKLRADLEGHVRGVLDIAFSPDGDLVATASKDGTARVWNTSDGSLVAILPGHPNWVTRLEFSPDGELIVTGSRDHLARVFDADSGTLRATFAGHSEAVTDVGFGSKGRTAVTASSDGSVRVWDSTTFPEVHLIRRASRKPIQDVAFTRAGKIVASDLGYISQDGRRLAQRTEAGVRVSDVAKGRVVRTIETEELRALAFSHDGEKLVTAHADGEIRVWRLSDGRVEQTFETQGSTSALAISRDGDRIVHGSRIIDARSGRPEHRIRTSAFGRHALTSASFSPDGRFVVTTGTDQEARLFDVATGGQVWVLSHASTISDAAFSADGRWVVIAGPGYAGVVDARSGERILLLKRYDTLLTAAAFSPTGWRIATGSDSGAIRTYDCRLCGEIDELVKLGEERLAQIRRAP